MKPTYREKNLLDYLFGGFRSTLKRYVNARGIGPGFSFFGQQVECTILLGSGGCDRMAL